MRFHLLFAVAALAVSTTAQTITTNWYAQFYGGRTSFTSRHGVAGANVGEVLDSRIGTTVQRAGKAFQASQFTSGGDTGTKCEGRRFRIIIQDQNGTSRESYRIILNRKSIATGTNAGDPDMSTGGLVAASTPVMTPAITRNSPVAWQITFTFTTNYPLECKNQQYYGIELPANAAWTQDGVSWHGEWYVSGSQGQCARNGAPHTVVSVNKPANTLVRPSEGRIPRGFHGTLTPTLDVGQDVDPNQVTRCNDPNWGAGGSYPDTSSPRKDGLVFRMNAAGSSNAFFFLSARNLSSPPLSFPFLKGRICLDALTLTLMGSATPNASGIATFSPAFTAQGSNLPQVGALRFQGIAQIANQNPPLCMTNTQDVFFSGF